MKPKTLLSSLITGTAWVIFCLTANTQTMPQIVRAQFLEIVPQIDGVPEPEVASLTTFALNPGDASSGDMHSGFAKAGFRLAYGTSFLYIYAEVTSDSLIFRDRGYQNGDGMLVVIGKPGQGGTPTREF